MDNILDKITEKFSAQDIIRANSQAEARESERIRLEAEEYKKQLDELRSNEKDHRAALDETKDSISSLNKRLDENDSKVHDIGVQVYRNVQAVVEGVGDTIRNENRAAYRELDAKLNAVQTSVEESRSTKSKSGGVIALLVITMLIAGADLVINILRILGVF